MDETAAAAPTGNLEITVSRAELLRELTAAQSVVERKTTIPILSNFLFEAAPGDGDQGRLTITATDPANHLRNIRVYMPGGACSNDLGTYAASAAACTTGKGSYVPFEAFPSAAGIWNPQFLDETVTPAHPLPTGLWVDLDNAR